MIHVWTTARCGRYAFKVHEVHRGVGWGGGRGRLCSRSGDRFDVDASKSYSQYLLNAQSLAVPD